MYETPYNLCEWNGEGTFCDVSHVGPPKKKRDAEEEAGVAHTDARAERLAQQRESALLLPRSPYITDQQPTGNSSLSGLATFNGVVSLHVGAAASIALNLSAIDQAAAFDAQNNFEIFILVDAMASMAPALATLNDPLFLSTLRSSVCD
jgi:hypothetical protein